VINGLVRITDPLDVIKPYRAIIQYNYRNTIMKERVNVLCLACMGFPMSCTWNGGGVSFRLYGNTYATSCIA